MKTIAIVIGVSDYQDPKFESIPGAKADAGRFATALISWGVPKEWIYQLSNENATKASLIKTFYDCRSHFDSDAKLIFYFAGHGVRETDVDLGMPESSLVLNDTSSANPLSTGLRIVELMQLIRTLKPIQVFLFIDACSLRLNRIENPLNDANILSTTTSKGLFCLLSSGTDKSYEHSTLRYGYFTNALLKAISELRHDPQPFCQDLAKKVSQTMREQSLPTPEIYLIGSENMWLLESHYQAERISSRNSEEMVMRWEVLEEIQNYLVTLPDPVIWIYGEGGIGKTVIAEQVHERLPNSLYISVPGAAASLKQVVGSILEQIRLQRSDLFFNRPPENTLHQILKYIHSQEPNTILMIDHLDRLQAEETSLLIGELDRISLPCILISRNPCPKHCFIHRHSKVKIWNTTPFNQNEIEQILIKNTLDPTLAYLILNATQGNALGVRQLLVKLLGHEIPSYGETSLELISCLSAIAACGGFLNERIFSTTFQMPLEILFTIEKLGLIRQTKQGYFPHDVLLEIVEANQWPLDLEKACAYWNLQVQQTPNNLRACRSLVLHASQFQDCTSFKESLGLCLETLTERENLSYLIDLASLFQKQEWSELLLKTTDHLIDYEEYLLALDLLKELLCSKKISIRKHAQKNVSRIEMWFGHYEDLIQTTTAYLKKNNASWITISLRNDLGISNYFLGNMDLSYQLFEGNLQLDGSKCERELGISKMMLGWLLTFRGGDIIKAKEYFDSSLQVFESTKSYIWTILAYNGLSDYAFRQKRWNQALIYLDKAQEIAEILEHKSFLLFTLMNRGRNVIKLYHIQSESISSQIKKMETLIDQVKMLGDNWVTIWAKNNLAVIYARRGNTSRVQELIEPLPAISSKYKWSHTITLSNLAHLALLKKEFDQAKSYYQECIALCQKVKAITMLEETYHDYSALPTEKNEEIDLLFRSL